MRVTLKGEIYYINNDTYQTQWHDPRIPICKEMEYTPFHLACHYGNAKIANMILEKSEDMNIQLNAKGVNDWTAFHLASKNGQTKIVEMLLKKAVEFNIEVQWNSILELDVWLVYPSISGLLFSAE